MEGPYGVHDFNYRRYPALMLVGGGVGITPVIGMLKDIYNVVLQKYTQHIHARRIKKEVHICHV